MKRIKYFLFVFIFLLIGCKRTDVTLDFFVEKATFNGYLIEENNTGYETYQNILSVHYAVNRENAYDIQFLELNDVDYAKSFFLLNVNDIKENISKNDYVKSKSLSNYELYHAENESIYYLIIRSNKNIIYIKAPINYINEIEEFLTDLEIDF